MRALSIALLATLTACAGTTPYRYSGESNVEIRSHVEGAKARLDIHRLEAQCHTQYEGSVALDQPLLEISIPEDRASVLVVRFETSSFLGGSRGSISREVTVVPRPGLRYRIDARYRDAIYEVTVLEITRGTARTRPLELGVDCTVVPR
jgi:hypothetical protein